MLSLNRYIRSTWITSSTAIPSISPLYNSSRVDRSDSSNACPTQSCGVKVSSKVIVTLDATGKIGQNVTVDNLEIGTVAHEI